MKNGEPLLVFAWHNRQFITVIILITYTQNKYNVKAAVFSLWIIAVYQYMKIHNTDIIFLGYPFMKHLIH